MGQFIPQPMGCQHPNIAPYGDLFLTKDDKTIVLAVGTEKQFENLCKCLGAQELLIEPHFQTNTERVQNRGALVKALEAYILQFEQKELLKSMEKWGVPAGAIKNMQEVFEEPSTQNMILEEKLDDGTISKRVKTTVFELR